MKSAIIWNKALIRLKNRNETVALYIEKREVEIVTMLKEVCDYQYFDDYELLKRHFGSLLVTLLNMVQASLKKTETSNCWC